MNTLFLLVAAGLVQPASAALHCPTPVAARGDIKGGPPLVQTFELTNKSAGTLTITKVDTGCGCVKRTLSANSLKPGETAKLTVEVNTLTQPDGPNRWQAVVSYSVDREEGTLPLTITANLSREVTVTPAQLAFSTTGAAEHAFTITDKRKGTMVRVKKITISSPSLTAEKEFTELAHAGMIAMTHFSVKLSADAPAGQRDELITLITDDPVYPEFRIPVRINKKAAGAVVVTPEDINLRLGSEEVSSLVQIRSPDGKNVRIESAESGSAAATVKFSTSAGPVATIRVTVSAMQSGSCHVKVKLAEPTSQEVVIPVAWTVGPKR